MDQTTNPDPNGTTDPNGVGDTTTIEYVGITKEEVVEALQQWYDTNVHRYVVETADGFFDVIQSITYGEMLISFLLFCILLVHVFKWIYHVLSD